MEQLPTASPTSCPSMASTRPLLWEEVFFSDPLPPGVQAIIPAHKRWLAFWRAEDGMLLWVLVHEQTHTRAWVCYKTGLDVFEALYNLARRRVERPDQDDKFVAFANHAELCGGLPHSVIPLLKRRMTLADDVMQDVDALYGFAVEHAQRLAQQLGFVCVPYDEGPTPEDTQRLWAQESAQEVAHDAWVDATAEAMRTLLATVLPQFPDVAWEQEPTLDVEDPYDRGFELSGWLLDVWLTEATCSAIERALESHAGQLEALRGLVVCAELGANTVDEDDFIVLADGSTVFQRVDLSLRACISIPDPDPY